MARAPATQEIEASPEADRLEGFPHPRHSRLLLGHEEAEHSLAAGFAEERLHHAWLVTGPAGIGKATFAYRLARHVLARPDERDPDKRTLEVAAESTAARQVTALSHPSLLVLRRPYDPKSKRILSSIPVDEVRKVKAFLGLTAGDKAWRVIIVDTANELNLHAANALLKSLEEPPRRALFVLVASAPGQLLQTIRSRCRRLPLQPLASAPLRRAVQGAFEAAETDLPPALHWDQLERLAEGSVRRALILAASGGLELHARIGAIFSHLPDIDWTAAHNLADTLSSNAQEQRFEVFFDLFLERLAALARGGVGQGTPNDVSLPERLLAEARLPAWASLWQRVVRDKAEAQELNLDRKALIMRALAQLQAAAKS